MNPHMNLRTVPTHFGTRYAVEDIFPDAEAVVIGWKHPGGVFLPHQTLLPHQLYVKSMQDVQREYHATDIAIARLIKPWVQLDLDTGTAIW